MTFWQYILLAAIVYCVMAPPKYDPAIRLKIWAKGQTWEDHDDTP